MIEAKGRSLSIKNCWRLTSKLTCSNVIISGLGRLSSTIGEVGNILDLPFCQQNAMKKQKLIDPTNKWCLSVFKVCNFFLLLFWTTITCPVHEPLSLTGSHVPSTPWTWGTVGYFQSHRPSCCQKYAPVLISPPLKIGPTNALITAARVTKICCKLQCSAVVGIISNQCSIFVTDFKRFTSSVERKRTCICWQWTMEYQP